EGQAPGGPIRAGPFPRARPLAGGDRAARRAGALRAAGLARRRGDARSRVLELAPCHAEARAVGRPLEVSHMRSIAAVFALCLALPVRAADPEIRFEKYQLPNGLTVILSEDHRLPQV